MTAEHASAIAVTRHRPFFLFPFSCCMGSRGKRGKHGLVATKKPSARGLRENLGVCDNERLVNKDHGVWIEGSARTMCKDIVGIGAVARGVKERT